MSSMSDLILRPSLLFAILPAIYLLCLSIYRLYLHPLSKFPGPKLAALTKWYEFYYDVIIGGRFTFHLQDLHKKYGPIIRINPDEIHIDDPDFYEDFYTKQGKQDKYDYMSTYFGHENSVFTTVGHDLHKARRAPIQALMSKSRVVQLQPLVREKSAKMVSKVAQHKQNGCPLTLDQAFMAVSEDVVFEFCFGQCYDVLDVPDFKKNLSHSFRTLVMTGHLAAHLPWIPKIMLALPESWLEKLDPVYATIFRLQRDLMQWVNDVKDDRNAAGDKTKHTTIMKALLDSNLPPKEKDSVRLRDEMQIVVGAAISTTGWAASVAAFHIIQNREVFAKLRTELKDAMPDPTAGLDWLKLEKLPYLSACIKEGIRLSVGESIRSPRIYHHPVNYKRWEIPTGTPTSMSNVDVIFNDRVFPEPKQFKPERWIDAGHSLDKYTVAFGKGSRSCLGMQLAYAELYHMIAGIFRSFDFELYETDISDVEFQYDFSVPLPKLDSKGVRVIVKADK